MAPGLLAPAEARTAIAPMGKMVTEEVLMAKNKHIALVAVPGSGFRRFSSFIALSPMGVAALPNPKALAAIFKIMADMAG